MNTTEHKMAATVFMPDGRPVPAVMVETEVIEFLRMKEIGIANPANTLRYYRETKRLRPTCIGNHNVYTLDAVLDFLDELTPKRA